MPAPPGDIGIDYDVSVTKKRASPKRRPAKSANRRRLPKENWLDGDCVIPGPAPSRELGRLKVRPDPEHEARHVREYMETQARDERVTHLEKVATERVFDRKHDVWDVHTNRHRWWVITAPTNLYSQKAFPSMDYVLSFHVGLTARAWAAEQKVPSASAPEYERFMVPWRRWEQATEAIDEAEEAEDFQAIGMRCRECLLAFAQVAADLSMLQPGQEAPKRGDFINWTDVIARVIARGSSAEQVRDYLRTSTKAAWQFVNWLTHAKNAVRADAQIGLDVTQHVLSTFGEALLRHEHGTPDRCPRCSSYQVSLDFRSDLAPDRPYVPLCARCGWCGPPEPLA